MNDLEDISNISDEDMNELGNAIEDYIELFEEIMIIPKELKKNKKEINEALEISKKLVKKLKKGDRSVFKDCD